MNVTNTWRQHLYHSKETVTGICQPLFESTPITYFDYQYYFDDGRLLALTTAPGYEERYVCNQFYPTMQDANNLFKYGSSITFMSHAINLPQGASDIDPDKYKNNILLALADGIYHRIYFVTRHNGYTRICGFGTNQDSRAIFDFYANATNQLINFINYFKQSADRLLRRAQQSNDCQISLTKYADTCNQSSPTEQPLQLGNRIIALTCREIECLTLHLNNYSIKKISHVLQVSEYTVKSCLKLARGRIGPMSNRKLRYHLESQQFFTIYSNKEVWG